MKTPVATLVLMILILCGCATTPFVTNSAYPHLKATLSPDGKVFRRNSDVFLDCQIQNVSGSSVRIDTLILSSPGDFIEVFDVEGKRRNPVPPSMPPREDERRKYIKMLRSGDSLSSSCSLYKFSPPLEPGTYKARLKLIDSNEVTFTILESMGK